ncbi:hypothetical protein LJC40_07905, partial [Synergistaceae bacterium OttesenSCG-928-D05]|nr:hypothetical protein [Synergistaceae bacterium OttesenSCG-928-D05]
MATQQSVRFFHARCAMGGKTIKQVLFLFSFVLCAVLFTSQAGFAANDPEAVAAGTSKDFGPGYEIEGTGNGVKGLIVEMNAQAIFGANASITTSGNNAQGVNTVKGSTVVFGQNAEISASGSGARAIYSSSVVSLDNGAQITAAGTSATGIYGDANSQLVEIGNGLRMIVSGENSSGSSYAIYANNKGTTSLGTNASLDVRGFEAVGIFGTTNAPTITVGENLELKAIGGYKAQGLYLRDGSMDIGNNATIVVEAPNSAAGVQAETNASGQQINYQIGDDLTLYVSSDNAAYGIRANERTSDASSVDIVVGNNADIHVTTKDASGMGISAVDNSRVTTGEDTKITVTGHSGRGIDAAHGAFVKTGEGTEITVTGYDARGINTSGGSSVETGKRTYITTTGTNARGIEAIGGSFVKAGAGTEITVSGHDAHGINAIDGSFVETGEGGKITATGSNVRGVDVTGENTKILFGGDIETSGDHTTALAAWDKGSAVVKGSILAQGYNGYGVFAVAYSNASVGGSVVTSGDSTHGVRAAYSTVKVSGDVTALGTYSYGVNADNGDVQVGGSVYTYGDGWDDDSYGVAAYSNSTVSVAGSVVIHGNDMGGVISGGNSRMEIGNGVTTLGDRSRGVVATTGGEAIISGDVVIMGANSYGLYASDDDSMISMADGQLSVAQDSSWHMAAVGGGTISLDRVLVSGASEKLLFTNSGGTVTAQNSQLAGDVLHDGTFSGTLALQLLGNSTLTGAVNVLDAAVRPDAR